MTTQNSPSKTNWPLIALLLTAGLFSAAQFAKLTLTLADMQAVYSGQAGFVPVLISLVGLVGIALGAVAGGVLTRIGLTRALLGAMVAGGVLSLIQSSLPPMPVFAALRLLEGLSHLAIVVICPTLMAGAASDSARPVVMGIWASFFGVSFAIVAALLPGLLSLGGLSAVFAAHGVGMIVMAAALVPFLPAIAPRAGPRVSYIAEHKRIYSTPRFLISGAGFGWYTSLYIALLAVLPLALDLPQWVIATMPVISLVGTFGAGVICRNVAPPRVAIAGFAATAVVVLALALFGGTTLVLLLMLVMGTVPGACFASLPYFNPKTEDRARATGGLAQFGNVGTTIGTPIFVWALFTGGMGLVTGLIVVFCIGGIATIATIWRKIPAGISAEFG